MKSCMLLTGGQNLDVGELGGCSAGQWLRQYNVVHPRKNKVGFYGLDVYKLWESLAAIIAYLDKKDPATKHKAMDAMACFEPYSDGEGRAYARASMMVPTLCEDSNTSYWFGSVLLP